MDNKAQGNTFWIVITAIVALVVLVILIMIFTGKTNLLGSELLSCESKGGFCQSYSTGVKTCKDASGTCKNSLYESCSYSSAFSCKNKDTQICCLGVKKSK